MVSRKWLRWLLDFFYYFTADTIDTWDEEKLKEVVDRKHGAKVMPKTEIVSNIQSCSLCFNFSRFASFSCKLLRMVSMAGSGSVQTEETSVFTDTVYHLDLSSRQRKSQRKKINQNLTLQWNN